MPKAYLVCSQSQQGVQILLQMWRGLKEDKTEQRDHLEDWIKALSVGWKGQAKYVRH